MRFLARVGRFAFMGFLLLSGIVLLWAAMTWEFGWSNGQLVLMRLPLLCAIAVLFADMARPTLFRGRGNLRRQILLVSRIYFFVTLALGVLVTLATYLLVLMPGPGETRMRDLADDLPKLHGILSDYDVDFRRSGVIVRSHRDDTADIHVRLRSEPGEGVAEEIFGRLEAYLSMPEFADWAVTPGMRQWHEREGWGYPVGIFVEQSDLPGSGFFESATLNRMRFRIASKQFSIYFQDGAVRCVGPRWVEGGGEACE